MLVHRGTLERAAFGVYRFPQYPVSQYDPYMVAVLWTRAPEACLSHETALDAYGISDVNPNLIHVTVAAGRRLRRAGGEDYEVHHQDLDSNADRLVAGDPDGHPGDGDGAVPGLRDADLPAAPGAGAGARRGT